MTLATELALDRIEGLLAVELPAHVRAFASAYAAGRAAPPAPAVLTDAATLAAVRDGLRDPALAARARKLRRLCALVPVENAVGPVEPAGWDELSALAARRNAAAQRVWGMDFLALAHDVYEVGSIELRDSGPARLPPIGADPITRAGVLALWRELTALPPPAIVIADARPRTFAIRPGEAIVVIRADATVQAWSAVAHELGHAWVAIAGLDPPRTLDEAVAITASRILERREPAAARIHARQETLAHALAALEGGLYASRTGNREPGTGDRELRPQFSFPVPRSLFPIQESLVSPPWALWHDPGSQAAYVAAFARAWTIDRLDDLRSRLS